jgi:hypothetical protein
METKDFFDNLIASQKLEDAQLEQLRDHRAEVESVLRDAFGDDPKIRYAGSKAKGTMIAESYDLDIISYFPHETDKSLKEIREEVQAALSTKYIVEPKTTALRIKNLENEVQTDYHIDVVPGRFIDETETDAFLHVYYGEKERMQTNIETHVAFIRDSGFQNTIKLMKLWKVRNDVPLKTFILEILVVRALKTATDTTDYATNINTVLMLLRDEIKTIRLEDPANSNNIVTNGMDDTAKELVALKAGEALGYLETNKDDEIAGWEAIFGGNDADLAKAVRTNSFFAAAGGATASTNNILTDERRISSPNSWGK